MVQNGVCKRVWVKYPWPCLLSQSNLTHCASYHVDFPWFTICACKVILLLLFICVITTNQGHFFIAINLAKFRGAATSQNAEFCGSFAAKNANFTAVSRQKLLISRQFRAKNGKFSTNSRLSVEFFMCLTLKLPIHMICVMWYHQAWRPCPSDNNQWPSCKNDKRKVVYQILQHERWQSHCSA